MQQVGSRELKNRLGHYLRIVRKGGCLLITDRGHPVAELTPVGQEGARMDAVDALLAELARSGEITLPRSATVQSMRPIRRPGLSLSEAVLEDRP
jgi:prevent-host-death family protein